MIFQCAYCLKKGFKDDGSLLRHHNTCSVRRKRSRDAFELMQARKRACPVHEEGRIDETELVSGIRTLNSSLNTY
jgi:hypothetical protein